MRIRVICPDCGEVIVHRDHMWVRIRANDRLAVYGFVCPDCKLPYAEPTTKEIGQLLVAGGVRLEIWSNPVELDEVKSGPPISYDDILNFHSSFDERLIWEELKQAPSNG